LRLADHPSKESYRLCVDQETEKAAKVQRAHTERHSLRMEARQIPKKILHVQSNKMTKCSVTGQVYPTRDLDGGSWNVGWIILVDSLKVVILIVGFMELGNPPGRGLTLPRKMHLRGNTPNMRRTSHDYSLMK
jgi:hypothetical protein